MAAPQRTLDEVKGWDDEAVASWARGSGLSAPVVEFLAKQAIDGEELFELTEANLVAYSLPLGHAKKLLRAIGILKAETAAPGSFATAAEPALAAAGKRRRDPSPEPAPAPPGADPVVAAAPAPPAAVDPAAPAAADPAPPAAADPAAPAVAAAGGGGAPASRVTELDLAISFDVTGSMGPCIFQVRRELERLSKDLFVDLAGMGVSVRVAVITQADYDATPYTTRHMDFSDDGAAVGAFITGVQASSGGWNEGEAYEQALLLANGLSWRASATKALIVIGDDLPHPPTWPANVKRVEWQAEAQALAARGVALYAVQCPCLDIPRARHFYEALAHAHPRGAYALLTQFAGIIDLLLALVFHATGDRPALEDHERNLLLRGRYSRGLEVAFNGLLGREDARRAALDPAEPAFGGAGGGGGAAGGAGCRGAGVLGKRVPVPPGRFQRLDVDEDVSIKEFVVSTGAVFKAGRGFYELSKPEDVSDKKEVVAEHVASGEFFSGTDAKELIGLSAAGGGKVRKEDVPAGYRVYVQSTSYNRKLVAGTVFLYEMTN